MKIKTAWNLGLLYKGDGDPQIEKDLKEIETVCLQLEKKYKNTPFTRSPETLAKALQDFELNKKVVEEAKPWWYFALKSDLDSGNSIAGAKATQFEQRITNATNKIKFFNLEVGKISSVDQKKFLKSPILAPYRYKLTKIFNRAKYNLPEGEEQLSDLLSQTSQTMWIDAQKKLLSKQSISFKGEQIPVVEAVTILATLSKKDRSELNRKIQETFKSISFLAEAELNAIYSFKKTMDERRGFAYPYSQTILGYQNDEKSIIDFVALISKNFHISHRFYRMHAKLLGEKKITMADRSVHIGKIKATFDFNESVSIVKESLRKVDPEYELIFQRFIENGQIDVYPKKGKKGGAYSWGNGSLPTFVLLNHISDIRSLETLAHEMGHSIHSQMSKSQPLRYQQYTTATAEVASTFFEQTIQESVEKHLSQKEQIVMLHNKIMGDITTIFRQVACFNFELELHNEIRKHGQVSAEDIAKLMRKHIKSYVGNAVDVNEEDGYFFVYWSHIRNFFYVYSYAYGQIISKSMYEKWKEDPKFASKIKQFLMAGGSASPEDIFKSIGIDTSKTSFFEAGLKGIERDMDLLEKLTRSK